MTLTYATLRDQIAALQAKRISAAELLEETIARIAEHDGKINAVIARDFEGARVAAREADRALARGERKPLLGLPVTVKESYNVAGLPTTWGSPAARDWRPTEDAVLVSRLKAAGAVVVGKTNVPLFLSDWQAFNDVYGTTNNPWDLGRTPGGSSGGSAASLAAGYVALELGSDIGGSLRVPAHFCGVFAHKPTYALLPMRGQTPPGLPPVPLQPDLAVVGPLARSAADLSLALDLLAGPDEAEAIAYSLTLPPPRADRLHGFRVLVLDTHPQLLTSAAVRAAIDSVAEGLERAGAKVAGPAEPLAARPHAGDALLHDAPHVDLRRRRSRRGFREAQATGRRHSLRRRYAGRSARPRPRRDASRLDQGRPHPCRHQRAMARVLPHVRRGLMSGDADAGLST